MAKGRMQLTGGARPQYRKPHPTAFTKKRQDRFFEVLAQTCNVTAACRAAKVAPSTVYRHQEKDATFRARWKAAIRQAYSALELATLERMMKGSVTTRTRPDGSVETIHQYPNQIALQLLRLHRQNAAEAETAAAAEQQQEDIEEVRERIARRIERLRLRIERERGQKGAEQGPEQGAEQG